MTKIRVALTDDHPIVLEGISGLVNAAPDMTVTFTASNGAELLSKLQSNPVDVVLTDIDMPVMNGIEAMAKLQVSHPNLPVLILTMHDERAFIKKLVEEGAKGYLLKNCSQEELLLAIRQVHNGKSQFSGEVTLKLTGKEQAASSEIDVLTARELEILRLIAQGKPNKEIGELLFISHRTVDTHRTNLMRKLNVNNTAGLVRIAFHNKLMD